MGTAVFTPKFISFDCYGTLTRFRMTEMATAFYADRLQPEALPKFCKDWGAYRLDEVLGAWKPYRDVIANSLERCSKKWGVEFREGEANAVYEAVPTWGPHEDVPGGLSKICDKIPLVILSNAMNSQIMSNVGMLGATFHKVCTAESAQAYKPRMQAFEYMFDQLGWGRKLACTCPRASAMTRIPRPTSASAAACLSGAGTSLRTRTIAMSRSRTSARSRRWSASDP